ncbi:molybdate ABC transporter substrate-binding protein [Psychromonas sp. MME2]|uniref:molybdate ABC transporter substrate-binding protein n=1 Tax=unclassified Psychromonas TaxID=2614957 RepID=UPI00339D0B2B
MQAQIKVAVASNFKATLSAIIDQYQQETGNEVVASSASTGTLYNQIVHGAPFDIFLSADSIHAEKIEQSKFALKGSRFTYAQGLLAFWQPRNVSVNLQSLGDFKGRLAIANPKLAPYGLAAKQSLEHFNLWNKLNYVKGTNIAQAYQFIESGSVQGGLVAYSLLVQENQSNYYLIPAHLYDPIVQQGVLMNTKNQVQAAQFINYLQSKPIQAFIQTQGYR